MLTTKICAAAITLAAAAALPASAEAATVTLGPPTFQGTGGGGGTGCLTISDCSLTLAQGVAAPGVVAIAPADGMITSWLVRGSTAGDGQIRLRVIHPAGGGPFTGVSTSAPATALDGTTPNAANLPIQAGDEIGVDASAGSSGSALISFLNVPGAAFDRWSPALAEGSTMSPAGVQHDAALDVNAGVQLTPPAISALSRTSGTAKGGERVTITGVHLAGATAVSFGSGRASILSASNGQITASAPANTVGTVDVRVTTQAGTSAATAADRYSVLAPPRTAVAVTNLHIHRSRFHAAGSGRSVGATGTTVRFMLSEPASVTFAVEKQRTGRRLHRTFTFAGRAGANSFTFTGRLGAGKLAPGAYRLVATATDAAGNHSRPARVAFRIVAG